MSLAAIILTHATILLYPEYNKEISSWCWDTTRVLPIWISLTNLAWKSSWSSLRDNPRNS